MYACWRPGTIASRTIVTEVARPCPIAKYGLLPHQAICADRRKERECAIQIKVGKGWLPFRKKDACRWEPGLSGKVGRSANRPNFRRGRVYCGIESGRSTRAVRISFDPQTISTDLYKILLDQRPKVANPLIIDLEAAKASTVVNKNLSVNRSKFGMVTCNTPTLQADFARQVPPEAQRVVDKVLCFVRRVSFMSPAHPDRAHRCAAGRGMIAPGWGATDPEPARPGGDPAECAAIDEGLTRRGDTNSSNSLFRSRN